MIQKNLLALIFIKKCLLSLKKIIFKFWELKNFKTVQIYTLKCMVFSGIQNPMELNINDLVISKNVS